MRMKTILFFSIGTKFGPKEVAINLLKHLVKLYHIVAVVDGSLSNKLPLGIQKFIMEERPFNVIKLIRLCIILAKPGKRLIHFNFPPVSPFWFPLLFYAKALGINIVYSFHGGIIIEQKKGHKIFYYLFLFYCDHIFDKIITNSQFGIKLLLSLNVPKEKLVQIPNGINISSFTKVKPKSLKGESALLFVGRFEYVKGIDMLPEMIRILVKGYPLVHLHLVGTGSMEKCVKEKMVNLGLTRHITLHGFLNGKPKIALYKGADIFVLPSRLEQFGITLLEAMAAGTPMIATNVGDISELIENGKTGLLVPPDPEAIASAVNKLWMDKKLYRNIKRNIKSYIKSFNWKTISQSYVTLYNFLLGQEY